MLMKSEKLLQIKLKFVILNGNNEVNKNKRVQENAAYFKISFANKKLKSSLGFYEKSLNLIRWNDILNLFEFPITKNCLQQEIKFDLYVNSDKKCYANAKLALNDIIHDENFTTISLELIKNSKSFLKSAFDFNDSKLVFEVKVSSFELFSPHAKLDKIIRKSDILNIHLKLHELSVSNKINKQCFIEVKANKQTRHTKLFTFNQKLILQDYFVVPVKYSDLSENFIELFLVEEQHGFRHNINLVAKFVCLLIKIYKDFPKHGFSKKWVQLLSNIDSSFHLKASIYIISSDVVFEENDESSELNSNDVIASQVSNIILRKQKFSVTFYFIEFFSRINVFHLNNLSCKFKFEAETIQINVDNVKLISQNGLLAICQEFEFKFNDECILEVLFTFHSSCHKKFNASIEFEKYRELLSLQVGPLFLTVTENNSSQKIGNILVKFGLIKFEEDFEASNNNFFKVDNVDCNIEELAKNYSKNCDYYLLIILSGISQLPLNLKNIIVRIGLKPKNNVSQKFQKKFFLNFKNKFISQKNIDCQNEMPFLLLKFKQPDQIYKLSVLNFIDKLITEILEVQNSFRDNNIYSLVQKWQQYFQLLTRKSEDHVDKNVENFVVKIFETYLKKLEESEINTYEETKVFIENLKRVSEFIESFTSFPDLQISILNSDFKIKRLKTLYQLLIPLNQTFYSIFMRQQVSSFIFENIIGSQINQFNPVLHINVHVFSNQEDILLFLKTYFAKIVLKLKSSNILKNPFKRANNPCQINEEFLYEIQHLSQTDKTWQALYFIDKSKKKYQKISEYKLNKQYLWVDDSWYLDGEGWKFAYNLNQAIWLAENHQELNLQFRRCKWLRKIRFNCNRNKFLKSDLSKKLDEALSKTDLASILNSQIAIARNPSIIKSYIIHVNVIEAKLLNNILLGFLKTQANKTNSIFFYSLRFFIFNKEKSICNKKISKFLDLQYLSLNSTWETTLEFKFEILEIQLQNFQIFYELTFNCVCCNSLKEIHLGSGFSNFELRNFEKTSTRSLIYFKKKFSTKDDMLVESLNSCIALIDLQLNGQLSNQTLNRSIKSVFITSLGIRLNELFFLTIKNRKPFNESSKLDLVFVMNGKIVQSNLMIHESYSLFENQSANNSDQPIKFENISFYDNYNALASPLDIYILDSSKPIDYSNAKIFKKIIGFNRINQILLYNSKNSKPLYENVFVTKLVPNQDHFVTKIKTPREEIKTENEFWTCYYNSLKLKNMKETEIFHFNILEKELENDYNGLNDYADTKIDILDFDQNSTDLIRQKNIIGELRLKILVCEQHSSDISFTKPFFNLPITCMIRLYVIKAFNIKKNFNDHVAGHLTINPYLQIFCKGHHKLSHDLKIESKEDTVKDALNPEFGELFEFHLNIPEKSELEIRILDRNMHKFHLDHSDHIICATQIDIEKRLTSKHRATCGLPPLFYEKNGSDKNINFSLFAWRDMEKPSDILKSVCEKNMLNCVLDCKNVFVQIEGEKVFLNSFNTNYLEKLYEITTDLFEQLCLNILNYRFNLVKEHIETRILYSPTNNKLEAGKMHMWLDIFPILDAASIRKIPRAINIQLPKPVSFELRCIIWNVKFLYEKTKHDSKNIFLKSWLLGCENQTQKTDTHFYSREIANFNFRFLFEFDYLWQEKCLIENNRMFDEFMAKSFHLHSKISNHKHEPKFYIQILSTDLLGVNSNIISNIEFDLNEIQIPLAVEPKKNDCKSLVIKNAIKIFLSNNSLLNTKCNSISLFNIGKISGWWPADCNSVKDLKCFVNMSLEILSADDAKAKPAGKGRSEPNMNPILDEPEREHIMDGNILNPFNKMTKTLKHLISKKKKDLIEYFFYLFLLIFLLLCIWSLPSALINRMIARIV